MRVRAAQVSLNQTAIDFEGNKNRIIESIKKAKAMGCRFRTCQENEIPGYSCEDHFKELDTYKHCWGVVADLLRDPELTRGILIQTTMPILHRGAAYNCMLIINDGKICFIRPKVFMADGGNYRESRHFSVYIPRKDQAIEQFLLPEEIEKVNGQKYVPFGLCNLRTRDGIIIGLEICEEVWRLDTVTRGFILECDVVTNCSASHFGTNKIKSRIDCIKSRTANSAGAYLYTNSVGCDGGKLYFDGSNLFMQNNEILNIGSQFSLEDVVVDEVVLDISQIRQRKLTDVNFLREASLLQDEVTIIDIDFVISDDSVDLPEPHKIEIISPQEQKLFALSSFLWDFIRKNKATGLFLPLMGGTNSSLNALAVYHLAVRLMKYINDGNHEIENKLKEIVGDENFKPQKPQDIVGKILFTAYIGEEENIGSRGRAAKISEFIGSSHMDVDIMPIEKALVELFTKLFGVTPKYKEKGGTDEEDTNLQNIQARVRIVLSYLMAQLIPMTKKRDRFLLVLATGNLDENLMGYFTKYDCASGDLNLVGSLSKLDVEELLEYLYKEYGDPSIKQVIKMAEVNHYKNSVSMEAQVHQNEITHNAEETISYSELKTMNKLRVVEGCGIVSMFERLSALWPQLPPDVLHERLTEFYTQYMINRPIVETLPPSLFLSTESCESSRYDLRPFIYETQLEYQHKKIREIKEKIIAKRSKASK